MVILLQDPHCHALDAVRETQKGEGGGTDKEHRGGDTSGQVGRAVKDTRQGQAASKKPGLEPEVYLPGSQAFPRARPPSPSLHAEAQWKKGIGPGSPAKGH